MCLTSLYRISPLYKWVVRPAAKSMFLDLGQTWRWVSSFGLKWINGPTAHCIHFFLANYIHFIFIYSNGLLYFIFPSKLGREGVFSHTAPMCHGNSNLRPLICKSWTFSTRLCHVVNCLLHAQGASECTLYIKYTQKKAKKKKKNFYCPPFHQSPGMEKVSSPYLLYCPIKPPWTNRKVEISFHITVHQV